MNKNLICLLGLFAAIVGVNAQSIQKDKVTIASSVFPAPDSKADGSLSKVWVPDNGDGTYKNPIIDADYSDPDAIRVGDDYFLISSSFNCVPGITVLHSKDLVNWKIINHVFTQQVPNDVFSKMQHGGGAWAPSIRYHNGTYYVYYPDPDFGIYVVTTKNPFGKWDAPRMVKAGKGFIDPCPFWDDNGDAYLVHAYAGSRAGIKNLIAVCKLSADGFEVIDDSRIVFDGHDAHETAEGPKFYKRNGFYYIMLPAGGVPTGYQLILRSKNIYGPYEEKIVLAQGSTVVNGPHQGAWVETQTGESWFIHFQDKGAYGRVVHLEPVKWVNDWPVMGNDADGDGKGEPVLVFKKPNVGKIWPLATPASSDEFADFNLGLQWQWHANYQPWWAYTLPAKGVLRMFAVPLPDKFTNFWDVPNLLLQKFPTEKFTATAKMTFRPSLKSKGLERCGLIVMGMDYAYLSIKRAEDRKLYLSYTSCLNAVNQKPETESAPVVADSNTVYFRVKVDNGALCQFSYSNDGQNFTDIGTPFTAKEGKWIGAKLGLFCSRNTITNDPGFVDVDWFRIE
jgi:beta-xylosidase